MTDHIFLWRWRVRKHGDSCWHIMTWRMTEEQARYWGRVNGYEVDRLSGTPEVLKK